MESSELRARLDEISKKISAVEKMLNEEEDLTPEEMEEYMKITKKLGDNDDRAGKSSRIREID